MLPWAGSNIASTGPRVGRIDHPDAPHQPGRLLREDVHEEVGPDDDVAVEALRVLDQLLGEVVDEDLLELIPGYAPAFFLAASKKTPSVTLSMFAFEMTTTFLHRRRLASSRANLVTFVDLVRVISLIAIATSSLSLNSIPE